MDFSSWLLRLGLVTTWELIQIWQEIKTQEYRWIFIQHQCSWICFTGYCWNSFTNVDIKIFHVFYLLKNLHLVLIIDLNNVNVRLKWSKQFTSNSFIPFPFHKRAAKCYLRILSYFSISHDLQIFTLPSLPELKEWVLY